MNLSSPYIAPILLALLVAITSIATLVQSSRRNAIRNALRALAAEWRMTYASRDRLKIADKIHDQLQVPGASSLSVYDVVYGAQAGELYCVFTVEFTTGVIRENKRVRRVASLVESRDPRNALPPIFKLAPEDVSLIDQYRALNPRPIQKEDSAPCGAESVKTQI